MRLIGCALTTTPTSEPPFGSSQTKAYDHLPEAEKIRKHTSELSVYEGKGYTPPLPVLLGGVDGAEAYTKDSMAEQLRPDRTD